MARVKPKRQGIHFDLTAMSDVAWLLLTFFILTTQFRKPETIEVATPKSVATSKLNDAHLLRVSINSNGKFSFSIFNESQRDLVLDRMAAKYKLAFTDAEKKTFRETQEIAVPITDLRKFLNLSQADREKYNPGIPLDSLDNQLVDWVFETLESDSATKLAIRGDIKTEYPKFKLLIKQLQERNMNKFQLITSAESGGNK